MPSPYSATLIEHFRSPRNQGSLAEPTISEEGANPLCGDRVRIELRLDEDIVREAMFTANACAICVAAASMLTDVVRDAPLDEVQTLTVDDLLRMLIESRDYFGGWSGNVRAWYERPGGARTVWLRYEDLVREPRAALEAALARLGVPLGAPTAPLPEFGDLHRRWPEFFRRGRVGAWRDEMSEQLHRLFWQHHGEAMGWFGYRDPAEGPCRTI